MTERVTPPIEQFDFPENGAAAPHDPRLRVAIHEAFNGACFYTGQAIAVDEMQVDHIIPRAHGGPDNIYNYAPTTSKINRDKSAAFDPAAVTPLLYLIRIVYAPRVLTLLEEQSPRISKPAKEARKEVVLPFETQLPIPNSNLIVTVSTNDVNIHNWIDSAQSELVMAAANLEVESDSVLLPELQVSGRVYRLVEDAAIALYGGDGRDPRGVYRMLTTTEIEQEIGPFDIDVRNNMYTPKSDPTKGYDISCFKRYVSNSRIITDSTVS